MPTLGFSSLPCACVANGNIKASAAHAAHASLRNGVMCSSYGTTDNPRALPIEHSTNRRRLDFAWHSVQVGRLSRFDDLPRKLVSDDLAQAPRSREQGVEIDSGIVAHAVQHVRQIFGADVFRRGPREGAPA